MSSSCLFLYVASVYREKLEIDVFQASKIGQNLECKLNS